MKYVFDIKLWITLGLILGLVIGFDHPDSSTMLMITLMIQMTLALQGLKFEFNEVGSYKKGILLCILASFVFNTLLTLATGLLFIDNTALWYGWIMLSAVPCAISVMTMTFYLHGNLKLGILGFTGIYIVALAITPALTYFLMGDAVSWVKILEYVILFIVVPVVVDIPLNRYVIPPKIKIIALNIVIMAMVFISIGFRRDYILSNPDIALLLLGANFVRIFVPSIALLYILKKAGCKKEDGIVYMAFSTWRNSGLAATLCIIMLGTTYPDAVLPAVLSLLVENIWFVLIQAGHEKMWPSGADDN